MAEYTYNGLNFRTGWHYDVTRSGGGAPDGTVDGNDPWYWFVYNERWQVVGTFRGSDANPKERFIYHGAGLSGSGGSSYIDSVVCLDRDLTNGWAGAADGTLEARFYINQNWRGDVAVVTDDVGVIQERAKYSAYGVPTCLASADYDGNGIVNSTDDTKFQADLTALDPLSDFNFDGATDFFDYLDFTAAYSTQLGENNGRGVLSRSAVGNRFGYAGYQWDPAIAGAAVLGGKWHVRHRVLDAERGTWLTRDPLGYHDGEDLYEYVRGGPVVGRDPSGLRNATCSNESKVPFLVGPRRGYYSSLQRSEDVYADSVFWDLTGKQRKDLEQLLGIDSGIESYGIRVNFAATLSMQLRVIATNDSFEWFGHVDGSGTARFSLGTSSGETIARIPQKYDRSIDAGTVASWGDYRINCSVRPDGTVVPRPARQGAFHPSDPFRNTAGTALTGTITVDGGSYFGYGSTLTASPEIAATWASPQATSQLQVGIGVVTISGSLTFSRSLATRVNSELLEWACDCPAPAPKPWRVYDEEIPR